MQLSTSVRRCRSALRIHPRGVVLLAGYAVAQRGPTHPDPDPNRGSGLTPELAQLIEKFRADLAQDTPASLAYARFGDPVPAAVGS